jgi:hypothetical protein
MRRRHLFEFEDQSWFPVVLRDAVTDWLCRVLVIGRSVYRPAVPLIARLLREQGENRVVDLCSGASGPWRALQPAVAAEAPFALTLTDKYPNVAAFTAVADRLGDGVGFRVDSVDATRVPAELGGVRTLFTGFHHFRPDQARQVLRDAFERRAAIGVFEFTERRWPPVLATVVLAPVLVLAWMFRLPPVTWRRLLFTYVLPVIPFAATWDGIVSNLRTYEPADLRGMVADLSAPDYSWEVGRVPGTGRGAAPVVYLLGFSRGDRPELTGVPS